MIGFILGLTLRQQVFRKSTLLLFLLAGLPVLIALLFRLTNDGSDDPQTWTAEVLYEGLIVTAVLPLTALMFGTSVIGDELEDGTAVYLLSKPVRRWQILVPKVTAPWLLTSAITVVSVVLAGLAAIDSGGMDIVAGTSIAMVLGALVYTVLFVMLSLLSTHSLLIGLIYVFIWEGALAGIFEGVRYLSVRHYTLGIADWASGKIPDTFDAYVGGETALILMAIVGAIAAVLANRRLERIEVRERP